ncbi:hypothetical protein ABC766_00205 [Methylobacterium fujisawaense]|uniref:hypothetical protein n=1 Tax=Methylobacterium fujisawaense TaxID=107400 RepID=UPI0031F4BD13
MRIPEIADRLREVAAEQGLPELAGLADELRRRPAGPKPPTVSQPMSEDLAEAIRSLKAANPRLTQVEIARRCQVNQGRVSEVLKGKRA